MLFDDCFHTTFTDVQYSRQLEDSYLPVLPNECIDAVTVLPMLWKSLVGAHEVRTPFPFLF